MTALMMGFVISGSITWFIYRWVHEARINGLQARIDGLTEINNIANERIKQRDDEIQNLRKASIGLTTATEEKQNDPPLEFKSFFRKDPSNPCISVVGITARNNNSTKHLAHCSLRIENIESSDPSRLCAIFSDSKISKTLPAETFFQLSALDNKNIPIAQFDSVNGYFGQLGIELLCISTQGYSALDPQQSYIVTLVGTAEIGIPVKRNYKLWIEGTNFLDKKLYFEEATVHTFSR